MRRPPSRPPRLRLLPLSFLVLLLLASCQKKQVWRTDFDTALEEAQSQGKDLFVLFSGEDWDGKTTDLRADVLDTDEFRAFVRDGYVLLNIDLSEAEQAMALVRPGAGEQELAEAERIQSGIDAKASIIQRYGVTSYPSLYVLSKEGYVLSIVQYNETLTSPAVLLEIYGEQAGSTAAIKDRISRVREASGAEKVRAIDGLYEASPEAGRRPLAGLVREVPALDPDDESGLVGKYEFIRTYDEALERIAEGQQEGVAESFITLAEEGHLDAARKQEAYYNAAYLMALFGESDYDTMYGLLQLALEADPESDRTADVSDLLEMVSKFRELMQRQEEEEESLFPGLRLQVD